MTSRNLVQVSLQQIGNEDGRFKGTLMRVFEEEQEGRTALKEGRREAGRRGTTPARRKTSICNLELANREK